MALRRLKAWALEGFKPHVDTRNHHKGLRGLYIGPNSVEPPLDADLDGTPVPAEFAGLVEGVPAADAADAGFLVRLDCGHVRESRAGVLARFSESRGAFLGRQEAKREPGIVEKKG